MTTTRKAYRAGSFYPAEESACRRQIEACLGTYRPPEDPQTAVAGIVPHAGWMFSGPTAAKVFKSLQEKAHPETFLIFGAVHVWGVGQKASMFAEGSWETPCGTIAIDEDLAEALLAGAPQELTPDASAHQREHSIEVQIPFIQYLFPEAKIVPIMVTPDRQAIPLGEHIGQILQSQTTRVVILGSTDLTHYGPGFGFTPYGIGEAALEPMKANDRQIIDLAAALRADDVIAEAEHHRNACGAGAIAATVATARTLGATQGYLLEHTTSYDVMPDRPVSDVVGYAGMLF